MKDKISPNYQDLFKLIAIIAMIIDHFGMFFWDNNLLRIIGRLSLPIFAFFAGYNYYFAKERENLDFFWERERYLKLFFLAILLQIIIWQYVPKFPVYNILFAIILGLFFIDMIDLIKPSLWLIQILALILLPFTFKFIDSGTYAFAFCYLGYVYNSKKDVIYKNLAGIWLCIFLLDSASKFTSNNYEIFLLIAIILFQFWTFNFANFRKIINWNFLLASRYILPIYLLHMVLFVLGYSFIHS